MKKSNVKKTGKVRQNKEIYAYLYLKKTKRSYNREFWKIVQPMLSNKLVSSEKIGRKSKDY